jgi:hypothetical protein
MTTNSEKEMRWVDAWNDLYDIIGDRSNVLCQLPDGEIVDVETCKGWLQSSAYEGFELKVEAGFVRGKKAVLASRWRA